MTFLIFRERDAVLTGPPRGSLTEGRCSGSSLTFEAIDIRDTPILAAAGRHARGKVGVRHRDSVAAISANEWHAGPRQLSLIRPSARRNSTPSSLHATELQYNHISGFRISIPLMVPRSGNHP